MSCPFLTGELKSTYRRETIPETWLPTCTVVTGEIVPVAVTVSATAPRSTSSVRNLSSCLTDWRRW